MPIDFEEHLVEKLLSFEEVDWEEDRVTLRVMSNGNYSDIVEARIWGKALGNIASTIVNKLMYKYGDDTDEKMIKLYGTMQTNLVNEIKSEIADLTNNEG